VKCPFDNLFAGRGLAFLKSLQSGEMYQLELEECLKLLEFLDERAVDMGSGHEIFFVFNKLT
jgi:hypothetical protein